MYILNQVDIILITALIVVQLWLLTLFAGMVTALCVAIAKKEPGLTYAAVGYMMLAILWLAIVYDTTYWLMRMVNHQDNLQIGLSIVINLAIATALTVLAARKSIKLEVRDRKGRLRRGFFDKEDKKAET